MSREWLQHSLGVVGSGGKSCGVLRREKDSFQVSGGVEDGGVEDQVPEVCVRNIFEYLQQSQQSSEVALIKLDIVMWIGHHGLSQLFH